MELLRFCSFFCCSLLCSAEKKVASFCSCPCSTRNSLFVHKQIFIILLHSSTHRCQSMVPRPGRVRTYQRTFDYKKHFFIATVKAKWKPTPRILVAAHFILHRNECRRKQKCDEVSHSEDNRVSGSRLGKWPVQQTQFTVAYGSATTQSRARQPKKKKRSRPKFWMDAWSKSEQN